MSQYCIVAAVLIVTTSALAPVGSPNFADRPERRTAPEEAITPDMPATESARTPSAWEGGLNHYFGASLAHPTQAQTLDALVAHLNRTTLTGTPPEAERRRWRAAMQDLRRQRREWRNEIARVDQLYGILLDYLACEAAYHDDRDPAHVQRLAQIVRDYAAFTPEFPPDRAEYVAGVIESEQRFAPPSVIFAAPLLPWRPAAPGPGAHLLEAPVQVHYADAADHVQALFAFGSAPGPVMRLDFDTVDAKRVTLIAIDAADGPEREAARRETARQGGVMAPLLLAPPVSADAFRMTVWPQHDRPVLRSLRVFAVKASPALTLRRGRPSATDGVFNEGPWGEAQWTRGFVLDGEAVFARSQTRFAAYYSHDALHIGVEAFEERMDTMAAAMTRRDDPLWNEEAVEVRVAGRGGLYRFLVNPLGTRSDARDGAWSWDGQWTAAARRLDDRWQAEIALPWSTLGLDGPGEIAINVVRYRRNVRDERSSWAIAPDGAGAPGELVKAALR